jgi:hypothetical protein
MNITTAVIYVDGTAMTRIDSECLVKCGVEGQGCAADLDACRARLTEAFQEIHNSRDIDVLFPELGECI